MTRNNNRRGTRVLTGAAAVVGLSWGCGLMVRETRLAVQNLAEEAKISSQHRGA